ncbi:MAG TPA: PqqD family protein [Cyclobacteriaceae bacterium]|nr:PqqD family protein [Cyclobacteriaceae bacterium]
MTLRIIEKELVAGMTLKLKKNLALSDSGFVFNPSSGDAYSTNPIGLEIIRYLKEGLDKDKIKALIIKKYNVEQVAFERDFSDFINTLRHLKLNDEDEEA